MVTISVPKTWSIQYAAECPDGHGTVILGTPYSSQGGTCPFVSFGNGIVWMTPLSLVSATQDTHASVETLHGLKVYKLVADDPFFEPASVFDVPEYGIRITATGRDSNRILRSIRVLTDAQNH